VNFYILTSKKIILTFILFSMLSLSTITYLIFDFADKIYTDDGYFTLHKFSKSKHFSKQNNKNNFDIVSIGSSKAQNHLTSKVFKKNGYSLYTFGVPATSLMDLPYMVNKIIKAKSKPKFVILSISIVQLYSLPKIKYPSFYDLIYVNSNLKNLSIGHRLKLNSRFYNIYDFIPIRKYAEEYNKVYFKDKNYNLLNKYISEYNINPDCEIFMNHKSPNSNRLLSVCSNGNGMLWYNNPTKKSKTKNLNRLDPLSIKLLNSLLTDLSVENITPIVLLEIGVYNTKYVFDIKMIKNALTINKNNIIDTVNIKFSKDKWADNGHINVKAIDEYSGHILSYIYNIK